MLIFRVPALNEARKKLGGDNEKEGSCSGQEPGSWAKRKLVTTGSRRSGASSQSEASEDTYISQRAWKKAQQVKSAILILCRLTGYTAILQQSFNAQIAGRLISTLRTAGLRSGDVLEEDSFVYQDGNLMFIKYDMRMQTQAEADLIGEMIGTNIRTFLHNSALVSLLSSVIRQRYPKFAEVDIQQVLGRLDLLTRAYVVPFMPTFTAQQYGEEMLRRWDKEMGM